jgi:uncharacterized membrane protein
MSDYEAGRYTGFKNFVFWMATKRRNWWVGVFVVLYWLAVAAAVVLSIAKRGVQSALPWVILVGAFGLMLVLVVVLVGFANHWGFPLVPDREQDDGR